MNTTKTNLVRQAKTNQVVPKNVYNLTTLDMEGAEYTAKRFAIMVKLYRRIAGITQQQLADAAGISKSYVGTIENARPHTTTGAISHPDRDVVINVLNALISFLPEDAKEDLDVDDTLLSLGYARTNKAKRFVDGLPEKNDEGFHDLEGIQVSFDEKKIPKHEQEKIMDVIRVLAAQAKKEK